jgi:hypothetical protein
MPLKKAIMQMSPLAPEAFFLAYLVEKVYVFSSCGPVNAHA